MTPSNSTENRLFCTADVEQTVETLRDLEGVTLLGASLRGAMLGSEPAVREYVSGFRALTDTIMGFARSMSPDRVSDAGGRLTFCDADGRPAHALLDALDGLSADAPFGAWAAVYDPELAVAIHLTNRVRGMLGVQPLPEPRGVASVGDDVSAQRFLRRVRFHLNHPGYENPLERIMEAFALNKTEVSRLFGVTRQAVDHWLTHGVPADRQEKLTALLALCDLLQRKLKADRLPGVARRPADAYGGLTMLEMIAADRHDELLALVRASFDWQTAA